MDIGPPPGVEISWNAWKILVDNQRRPGDIDLYWEFVGLGRLNRLWDEHRDYILAKWIARYPGTRPNNWWLKEMHGARRQRLSGEGWAGLWSYWCGAPRGMETPSDWTETEVFESQAAYLLRNNLLLPGEAERLTQSDYAPVTIHINTDVGG